MSAGCGWVRISPVDCTTMGEELRTTQRVRSSITGEEMTWAQIKAYVNETEIDNVKIESNEVWFANQHTRERHQDVQPTERKIPSNQRMFGRLNQNAEPKYQRDNKTGDLCYYCNKPNHHKNQCWRMLGHCLVCGSPNHRIANCPNRRSSVYEGRGPAASTPVTPGRRNPEIKHRQPLAQNTPNMKRNHVPRNLTGANTTRIGSNPVGEPRMSKTENQITTTAQVHRNLN